MINYLRVEEQEAEQEVTSAAGEEVGTTSSSSSGGSSSTSTTTTTTTTKAFLVNLYQDAFGHRPTPLIVRQLEDWILQVGPVVVEYAITEAAIAPTPSWRYALAILRNCEGIYIKERNPNRSLRMEVDIHRSWRDLQRRKRAPSPIGARRPTHFSDDETQMPY